jgi:transmembrane sensor
MKPGDAPGLRRLRELVREEESLDRRGPKNVENARKWLVAELDTEGPPRTVPRHVPRFGYLAAAILFAAAALFALGAWRRESSVVASISFTVSPKLAGKTTSGELGRGIEIPSTLAFSDGAKVEVLPRSKARVLDVTDRGARLALEQGAVEVAVIHRDTTEWFVESGPFEVRVTGTKFFVSWDAVRSELLLEMHEGSVRIQGCGMAEVVARNEKVTLRCPPTSSAQAHAHADAGIVDALAAVPAMAPAELPRTLPATPATPATSALGGVSVGPRYATHPAALVAPHAEEPSYLSAMGRGDYSGAYALVATDFALRVATCGPRECRALGDVARISGHRQEAKLAYAALRASGTPRERSVALFYLGKFAHEDGTHAKADESFRESIELDPGGPFVREALGRRLEIHGGRDAGSSPERVRLARSYLEQYPDGPHANKAKELLR